MQFLIDERKIECENEWLIGDNADYTAQFAFDAEWDGLTKTARFQMNKRYVDVILEDDACKIPVEILKQGIVEVGVYTDTFATTPCEIKVKASIKQGSGNVAEPNEDVYGQLIKKLDTLGANSVSDERVAEAVSTYMSTDTTLVKTSELPTHINDYLLGNSIGNTTKVINVMDNKIANCAIDGVTDDYTALNAIKAYVNSATEPITLLFPYTGNAMVLSDEIHFTCSNITIEMYCDVKFTKSLFEDGENMTVFKFGSFTRTPVTNVNFIGHNITIDANGASLGIAQESHSQVAEGNGIRFQRVLGGMIKGVHVTNALCDGILVYTSKNVIVEDCEVSGTIMDNGLTVMGLPLFTSDWVFDKYDDRCWNNNIVRNCTAYNNEDLGFSASCCHGVTFENCLSYANGNVDGFNAGGGYSAEILFSETKLFFEVPLDFDMEITFKNCKALNNNNYAFYMDMDGVTIDNCYIDKTISNDTETSGGRNIRGGNGVYSVGTGRLDILNTTIGNTALYAICINPNSNVTVRIEKANIKDCTKGIYVPCVAFLYIKDLICKDIVGIPLYLNDGDKKKYVELKNLSFYDCAGLYVGSTEYMDADNIYLRTASGVTVASTLANVDTGILQNVKVYKGDNTSWLTGIYVVNTTATDFLVSSNILTDANTAINDTRTTTTE